MLSWIKAQWRREEQKPSLPAFFPRSSFRGTTESTTHTKQKSQEWQGTHCNPLSVHTQITAKPVFKHMMKHAGDEARHKANGRLASPQCSVIGEMLEKEMELQFAGTFSMSFRQPCPWKKRPHACNSEAGLTIRPLASEGCASPHQRRGQVSEIQLQEGKQAGGL